MSDNRIARDKAFLKSPALQVLILALLVTTVHQGVLLSWTSDDAFISFRYAENLVSGKGLVFNPGEKTEGFSNFLWLLFLAFFRFLGLSLLWTSKLTSYLFSLLIIFFIFRAGQDFGMDALTSSLCTLAFSFSSSLAYYSMSGLETVFYTFLLLLSIFLNQKYEVHPSQKKLSLVYTALLAASITRPEGLLFLLASSVYHLSKKLISKKGLSLLKIIITQSSAFIIYGFLIALRYWYYHDILPNTFYAKPKGTFASQDYNAFFSNFNSALLSGSFLLIPLLFLIFKGKFLKKHFYPVLFCGIQLVFMSYAGDWMALGRFFLPALPIVILLFFLLLHQFLNQKTAPLQESRPKWRRKYALISVILLLASLNVYQTHKAVAEKDTYPYLVMNSASLVQLGKWLHQKFPEDTVIALRRQGAVPYYSGMKSIDILGLTDREIARTIYREKDKIIQQKKNAEYIVNQGPNIIIFFSFKPDYFGWKFDESQPEERLYFIEYLIYKLAVEKGYTHLKSLPFGREEKVHILKAPGFNYDLEGTF